MSGARLCSLRDESSGLPDCYLTDCTFCNGKAFLSDAVPQWKSDSLNISTQSEEELLKINRNLGYDEDQEKGNSA